MVYDEIPDKNNDVHSYVKLYTLWLNNIAMENHYF